MLLASSSGKPPAAFHRGGPIASSCGYTSKAATRAGERRAGVSDLATRCQKSSYAVFPALFGLCGL
jgi:hypothetical protein